jgi:D-apionolactonase
MTLRDQHWATLLPRVSNFQINAGQDSFELSFDAVHHQAEIDFSWHGRVIGEVDGTVTFTMEGQARSSFLQNRVGFCLLHPIRELAGNSCEVEQSEGAVLASEFPFYITPHQPFTNIRAIRHKITAAVDVIIRFRGGIFETEDQRNWTDGSFKTYSPPLCVPYPAEIKVGNKISQTINIALTSKPEPSPIRIAVPEAVLKVDSEPSGMLPRIGLGFAQTCVPLTKQQRARIQRLNLNHLRVDLELCNPEYSCLLERAWAEAHALGLRLEMAVILDEDPEQELQKFIEVLMSVRPDVFSWLVFRIPGHCSTPETLALARKYLSRYDDKAPIAGGTNANFAELNRCRPDLEQLDAICYSVNPQVHGSDNSTLVEALEAQGWTVLSAKHWAQARPIWVSPVTLKPRFNPYGQESSPQRGALPSSVDSRQMSLFGAAWTLGSLKYLTEHAAGSVTYFETHGWRGVQDADNHSDRSHLFLSVPGCVFPLYHVLLDVGEFAGAKVVPVESSDHLRVEGLALIKDGILRLMCTNFTGEKQPITVRGINGEIHIRELNGSNAEQAMLAPEEYRSQPRKSAIASLGELKLELPEYGLARLEVEVKA